ncbi:short-chain alcohol dehydrogenase [Rhizoctonia solani]
MGTVSSILEQNFPQAPKWSVNDAPDLDGKVFVVTGGNTGIGFETCKALLSKNAKVYLCTRCPKRGQDALEQLHQLTGKYTEVLSLDLANLDSVREAARELTRKETEIYCLINNGGVLGPPLEAKTAQGYDLQFGTNVLGHYLFTTLLLPMLLRTSKTSGVPARIVTVSSFQHLFAPKGGVDYDSLVPNSPNADRIRERMGRETLYSQSKWALIAFTNELARQYDPEDIIAISLNPGNIRTEITRHVGLSGIIAIIAEMMLWDCSYGALSSLYAGSDPGALQLSGKKRKATNIDDIDVDAELEAGPSTNPYLKRGRTGTVEAGSRAGSMAPNAVGADGGGGEGDDDDEEAPAMADDDYSAQLSWQSQSKENMKLLLSSFTPDQLARYETYRRSTLNKQSVRRFIHQSLGANVSVNVAQVIAGFSKVFVGEIIELGTPVTTHTHTHTRNHPVPIPDTLRKLDSNL